MLRGLVLLLLLAGCGDASKSCRVDSFALADAANQQVTDCGSFSLDSDAGFNDAAMAAAVACVTDAVKQKHAFRLLYDVWDPYRHLRAGYTGALHGGKLIVHVYAYVGDTLGGSFDPRPSLTQESCATLTRAADCTIAAGRSCLSCDTPTGSTSLCHY